MWICFSYGLEMSTIKQSSLLLVCLVVFANGLPLSKEDEECFKTGKFYHKATKKCHDILSRGPCREGEWFVLQKPESEAEAENPKAICQEDKCKGEGFLYGDLGCVGADQKEKLCGADQSVTLGNNNFGEGECLCTKSPPHARRNNGGKCYQLYKRKPCKKRQIFGVESGSVVPKCIPDPCYEQTLDLKYKDLLPVNATLAMYPKDRKCYQLDTKGPCAAQEIFKVSDATWSPSCVQFTQSIFNLEKQDGDCQDGACQATVVVLRPPEDSYKQSIITTLKNLQRQRMMEKEKLLEQEEKQEEKQGDQLGRFVDDSRNDPRIRQF